MILETAWQKLYPTVRRPFEIQTHLAVDSSAILLKITRCIKTIRAGPFALFDFDEALQTTGINSAKTFKLTPASCSYRRSAMAVKVRLLLPVPVVGQIRGAGHQPHTGGNFGASRF